MLTVALQDCIDVKVLLKENGNLLHFSCRTLKEDLYYECDLELFRPVVPEESQHAVKPRQVELKLKKALGEASATGKATEGPSEEEIEWPRLTKEKKKNPCIQVDWAHWVQEDESEEEERDLKELGDFGMSEQDLVSTLSMKDAGRKDAAEKMNIDESLLPKFGCAAGQQPIPDEVIMSAVDDMPPLEDADY